MLGASPVVAYTSYWVFLGDSYRVTNLLPFFLLGALLMRHGFRRDRTLWIMAAISAHRLPRASGARAGHPVS